MIAAIVHFFKTPTLLIGSALLWALLILLLSFLMISTVRYSSFKEVDVKKAMWSVMGLRSITKIERRVDGRRLPSPEFIDSHEQLI